MKRVLSTVCVSLCIWSASAFGRYTAEHSTEAILSFQGLVEWEGERPSTEDARAQAEAQVQHLYGTMSYADISASPKENHKITSIRITQHAEKEDTYKIRYNYRGTVVLEKGPRSKYDVLLPVNPDTIFEASMDGDYNPCTDDHYQSEGDFWYFWSPERKGCKLKEGRDYLRIEAGFERIANQTKSYPEYPRLVDSEGRLTTWILMGMDKPTNAKDPMVSDDINAQTYRTLRKGLLKLGLEVREWTKSEVRELTGSASPTIEEFTFKAERAELKVFMFFGESGIDERSTPFHFAYRHALEKASVMIYDGHSGLGGHLDLDSIEAANQFQIKIPKDRYQIYFFNSCTSYSYYNTLYFEKKKTATDRKGSKNLDILTNGLETYFDVMKSTNLALISAFKNWAEGKKSTSYQELAQEIDSDNLFGVNGDEDNPKRAP
jgi:hypothetical protein